MTPDQNVLIEVFSGTLWEAEMVKSLLENAQIESFVKNSVLNSYAYEPVVASGVKVMILYADLEQSKIVIADYYNNLIK